MGVRIQTADFDVGAEYRVLRGANPQSGAIVFFIGLVRDYLDDPHDRAVQCLELEHYAQMTENLCQQIIDKAVTRFGISDAQIVHRVGALYGGQQIVFVGVAGEHRAESFEAAQYIMDYLKAEATIWKKEVVGDESQWLGVKAKDAEAVKRWALND